MPKKIRVSVILPTFNEAGNIIDLVEDLIHYLSQKRMSFEIIVVDDDSPDKTGILARKYFTKNHEVRVIIRKKDKGLANSIRTGIEAAVGEMVVVMDTDFNHEPRVVPRLVEKCQKYDLVIGSRFIPGGGMADKKRELLSKIYNKYLIQPILQSPVSDNLSGFFAMKYEKLSKLEFDKIFYGYGDYFIRLIYYSVAKKYKLTEVPSFYIERTYGQSKSKFLQMFQDYVYSAIKLRLNK